MKLQWTTIVEKKEEEAESRGRRERGEGYFLKKILRNIMAFSLQVLGAPTKLLGTPSSTHNKMRTIYKMEIERGM